MRARLGGKRMIQSYWRCLCISERWHPNQNIANCSLLLLRTNMKGFLHDTPYDQRNMELMAKWPHCPLHHRHCYITKGSLHNGEHFNFELREWGIWVTAMSLNKPSSNIRHELK